MDAITNFTFQYVSINTSLERAHSRSGTALHSNMFLLILDPKQITVISYNFTFQYVSINTKTCFLQVKNFSPLHSNMFLLIPGSGADPYRMCRKLYIPICFY